MIFHSVYITVQNRVYVNPLNTGNDIIELAGCPADRIISSEVVFKRETMQIINDTHSPSSIRKRMISP